MFIFESYGVASHTITPIVEIRNKDNKNQFIMIDSFKEPLEGTLGKSLMLFSIGRPE
jgi:hypothetical protein